MNRYRLTLRNGREFVLESDNDLQSIVDRITITPATIHTAPYWVFDKKVAVATVEIVAIEALRDERHEAPL